METAATRHIDVRCRCAIGGMVETGSRVVSGAIGSTTPCSGARRHAGAAAGAEWPTCLRTAHTQGFVIRSPAFFVTTHTSGSLNETAITNTPASAAATHCCSAPKQTRM